jgi:hypothetical protein
MKFVFTAFLAHFASSSVLAAPISCVTANPCAWAGLSSLGFCAPNKFTVDSTTGSVSDIKLYKLVQKDGQIRAQAYKSVSLTMTESSDFVAVNSTGNIKLEIGQSTRMNYANLTGELSFGDYGFKVKCLREEAIGWE